VCSTLREHKSAAIHVTLLARLPDTVAEGQVNLSQARLYYTIAWLPAQRQAEVLGTLMHAQLHVLCNSLHYAPLAGIGSGQRQLIAVTCLAEHV